MKTRGWNPPSLRFGATRMENGGWNSRSVLDCGSPLPLLTGNGRSIIPQSAGGPAQSKTWRLIVAATRKSAAIRDCISHRRFPKRRYASGGALLCFCFLLSAFSFRAWGQSYAIDWYKISGGGGTSTNGQYSVSGTIGQPDASGALTGGEYSVTGGFWSLYAVQTPGAPLLTITYSGNQAIVSWPSSVTGWTLQTNQNLTTGNWGNYAGSVINNSVTNSPPKGNLFFRLKNP